MALFSPQPIALPKYPYLAYRIFSLFIIYALCRALFLVYNLEAFPGITQEEITTIFLGGLRFDLTAIIYLNSFYLLFMGLPLPYRLEYSRPYRWFWNAYYLIINIIGIGANVFDTIYYQFTLHRTTFVATEQFQNESNLLGIFFKGLIDFWPPTLAGILMVSLLVWIFNRVSLAPSNLPKKFFYPGYALMMLPLIYFSVIGARGGFGHYTRPISMNHAGMYVTHSAQMAIVLNTPFTFLRTIRKQGLQRHDFYESEKDLATVYTPENATVAPGQQPNNMNVMLLILESFGTEVSGYLNPELENGNYEGLTPFLDSLMQDSLVYQYGIAHGRKSIDAIPATMFGIPSMRVSYVISHYGTNKMQGLGTLLKERGYSTSFFHGAPNGSMGFNSIAHLAGFSDYYGLDEFEDSQMYEGDLYDGTWGIWDEEFMQYMAAEIDNIPEPFAVSYFSLSSHHPYVIPERYAGKFKPGPTLGNETHQYADHALKEFFDTIKTKPWFDDTLFVIVADHATTTYHREYQNDVGNLRVPIILYKPDGSLAGLKTDIAQQTDIFPTILDALDIDTDYFAFGHSLLDEDAPRFAVSWVSGKYQLVQGDWVLHFDGKKTIAFYNLKQDPLLKNNLVLEGNELVQTNRQHMDALIKAYLQQYNNRMIDDRLTLKSGSSESLLN